VIFLALLLCALFLPTHHRVASAHPRGVAVEVEIPRATSPLVAEPLDLRDGSTQLEVRVGRDPAPTPRRERAPAPL
jgi:hypothetical protein